MTIQIFGDSATRHFRMLKDSWIEKLSKKLGQDLFIYGKVIGDLNILYAAYYHQKNNIKDNDVVIICLSVIENTLDESELLRFIIDLNNLSKEKNLKTIVFTLFDTVNNFLDPIKDQYPYIHFAHGKYSDVARNEWKSEHLEQQGYEWLIFHDIRVNHMIKSNHKILFKKIMNFINNNTPIDLTDGFKKEIIDIDLLNNEEFQKDELFNGFVTRAVGIQSK